MEEPICIQIINKEGRIETVPVSTWENGLKRDSNWKQYTPPNPKPIPISPIPVELKKPPTPVVPERLKKIQRGRKKGK